MRTLTEHILDAIENMNIFEMAKNRSDLKRDLNGMIQPLFQHWCLIRYCALYDFGNINKDHWCGEVANYINHVQSVITKGYDKTKCIKEIFINQNEYNNNVNNRLFNAMMLKFNYEHIDISDEQANNIVNDWIDGLNELCNVMGQDVRNITMFANEYIQEHILKVDER